MRKGKKEKETMIKKLVEYTETNSTEYKDKSRGKLTIHKEKGEKAL